MEDAEASSLNLSLLRIASSTTKSKPLFDAWQYLLEASWIIPIPVTTT